jgi:hypothetical protein
MVLCAMELVDRRKLIVTLYTAYFYPIPNEC